jgi:hypothetical protein
MPGFRYRVCGKRLCHRALRFTFYALRIGLELTSLGRYHAGQFVTWDSAHTNNSLTRTMTRQTVGNAGYVPLRLAHPANGWEVRHESPGR